MNLSYRADIDGLRAAAVLLVIFNHIGWTFFSGGYIGVDIFFVISGYLITTTVIHDIQTEKFSVARFYKKRVVRLAPAYFTVLTAVSLGAWHVLLPDDLMTYFKSVLYATFLMANIFMQKEVGDYFSQSVHETPLLHLWSLGVEEQFYIFWPLILLFFVQKRGFKHVLWLIGALFIASLAYAQFELHDNAEKAYYSMPVRAFELLCGALICFMPKIKLPAAVTKLIVWLCLAVIFAAACLMDHKTPFPGVMALFPCVAAALIIYAGGSAPQRNLLLSNGFSRWVGKISYPLYLWHWPVIVLFYMYMRPMNALNQFLVLVISLSLAYLTYIFIEKPSKRFVMLPNKTVILAGFVLPALLFSSAAFSMWQQQGYPQRFPQAIYTQTAALNAFAHEIRYKCMDTEDPSTLPKPEDCVLGRQKDEIDFLLIGDSHANSYSGMLDVWAKDAQLRGYDVTQSSTFYLPDVHTLQMNYGKWIELEQTKQRNDAITAHLAHKHYPVIILAGGYYPYFHQGWKLQDGTEHSSEEIFEKGLMKAIAIASQSADQVILLDDMPRLMQNDVPADCIVRNEILNIRVNCAVSRQVFQRDLIQFYKIVARAEHQFPQLRVIRPAYSICGAALCSININGVPLYRNKDDNHLNYIGSQQLGLAYIKQFGNPLKLH